MRGVLQPYAESADTRTSARVALGRLWLAAGRGDRALELAKTAQEQDPQALAPVLLALDLMNAVTDARTARAAASAPNASATKPANEAATEQTVSGAEALVRRYLAGPGAEPLVRQAFASVLAGQQRLTDAAEQLRLAAAARPQQAQLWLGLGEVELELRQPHEAEAALNKALAIVTAEQNQQQAAEKAVAAAENDADQATAAQGDDAHAATAAPGPAVGGAAIKLSRVQLQLARAAEMRKDDAAANRWLDAIDPKDVDLQVLALRATLLAHRGQIDQARALIHDAPATTPAEERYRLLTETQLLLDADRLDAARALLSQANAQTPDDVDLIYQEAMVDERLNRLDEMEALLRRILALQPNNSQALNALGYSLADRNLRLEEALGLVRQAHEISPTDPFIVDSLGWVLYRMGQYAEAANLLNQAYASRQDTEIAAHLGEALWADGRHDEAVQVLRDAHERDATNEVLKQTMARLKVQP